MEIDLWVILNITTNTLQSDRNRNQDCNEKPRIFYREQDAKAFITSRKNNIFNIPYWQDNEFKPVKLLGAVNL